MIKKTSLFLIVLFLSAGLCFAEGKKEVTPAKEKVLRIITGVTGGLDPAYFDT